MQGTRCRDPILASELIVIDVEVAQTAAIFCFRLSAVRGIMVFLVAVIAGDLGNVPPLACHLFGGSSVGSGSRDTVFLSVPLSSVGFPLLVLSCLLGGLVSLLGRTGLIWDLI